MKFIKFLLVFFLLKVNISFANDFLEEQNKNLNFDVSEEGTQFVKNWQNISESLLKEIEKINSMNDSNFNKISEKQFIDTIKKSVENYSQTLLSLERKKESQSNLDFAKSALFPKIDIGAGSGEQSTEYPTGTFDGSQDRLTLSFTQLLYDFKKSRLSIDAAKKNITRSELIEQATKLDNCLLAIQYYLEHYRASALLSLAIKQTESAQALVLMLSEKEKLGGTSQHEIARVKIKYAEALNKLPQLEQNLITAKNYFDMFFTDLNLNPKELYYPIEPKVELIANENIDELIKKYPKIMSLQESIDSSALEIDALKRDKFGGFYLEGSAAKVNGSLSTSAQDSESIMIIYRSNVFSGGAHKAKISGAKSKLSQQKLEFDQLKKDYRIALNQAKFAYLSEEKTYLSTKEIVEQSMFSFKGTLELFLARKGGLLDVFSIQESIFDSGSLLVNSFVNKTLAKYRYMHITGQLYPYIFPKI